MRAVDVGAGSRWRPRVIGVQALNVTAPAANRHLMIFDLNVAPVNGQRPALAWDIPSGAGLSTSVSDANQALRSWPFHLGIATAISTTAGTLTLAAAGDISYQVWFK